VPYIRLVAEIEENGPRRGIVFSPVLVFANVVSEGERFLATRALALHSPWIDWWNRAAGCAAAQLR
jgi:hypothetical protein